MRTLVMDVPAPLCKEVNPECIGGRYAGLLQQCHAAGSSSPAAKACLAYGVSSQLSCLLHHWRMAGSRSPQNQRHSTTKESVCATLHTPLQARDVFPGSMTAARTPATGTPLNPQAPLWTKASALRDKQHAAASWVRPHLHAAGQHRSAPWPSGGIAQPCRLHSRINA